MTLSPEGVFQIDDSAKRTILTNIERPPLARIPIQPISDRVGGGNRTVPQQGASPMAIDWPADSAIRLSRVSDGSL